MFREIANGSKERTTDQLRAEFCRCLDASLQMLDGSEPCIPVRADRVELARQNGAHGAFEIVALHSISNATDRQRARIEHRNLDAPQSQLLEHGKNIEMSDFKL